LLARSPRGAVKDVLELGHGFAREMQAKLALAGLVTVVTETLRVNDATFKIERIRGRRSPGNSRLNADRVPSTGRNGTAAVSVG
jgi:hypothetical protein